MKLPTLIRRIRIRPTALSTRPFERSRRSVGAGLLCLAAVLCLAPAALAQDTKVDVEVSTTPTGVGSAEFEVSQQTFDLPLDRAIVMALRHNIGLAVERYSRENSLLGIDAAQGIYDLNLLADLSTASSSRPQTSQLEDTEGTLTSETDRWNFSINQLTTWGGTAELAFNNSSETTSDQNQFINPLYSANARIGFRQPLLRNFGRDVTNRNIIVAQKDSTISREEFRSNVESVVRQVSDLYWDLVAAREQLEVSEETLELAKELHEMNRIQVEVGTLAPLEMVTSEASVAAREEEIIRQRATVEDVADSLRRLINLQPGPLWDVAINPLTETEVEHRPIVVAEAIETALDHRVDVIQQKLQNEKLALDYRVAHRNKLPQLDLTAGIGYNGSNVDFTPTGPEDVGYSGALDQVAALDFEFWSVALTFSYPLQNRTAEALAAQAELSMEQGDWALRDLESFVLVDVRRAVRGVETAAKSIESAKVASKLARRNLEAEQKRYENGLSTSFTVLEIQEDLSSALSREVSAVIGYRKALTAYHLAIGRLLDEYGVSLSDDDEGDSEG